MANIEVRDGDGLEKFFKAMGAGTDGDPFIRENLDTNSAAILTAAQAIQAAVEILDDIVSGSEAQVDVLTLPTPTLLSATGTIATSGDNTVIDVSAAPGYAAGDNVVITHFILQNESSTATTAIVKDGATNIARVLGQNQGDGLAFNFSNGLEWRLSDDVDLVINLSGANSFGYTIFYYLES